ncbi:MAG: FecR domain-containing protein [Lentisphaerae bacterium]|nr:FecR domain-containing protein [Lentisphaerota bacterium]
MRISHRIMTLVIGIGLLAAAAPAEPFEPLFQAVNVNGSCMVQPPGAEDIAPVEEGKAYPYGSRLKTGEDASLDILFSKGNTCSVGAATRLTVDEDAENPENKLVLLEDGKLAFAFADGFREHNGLNVQTLCAGIEVLEDSAFRLETMTEGDLNLVAIMCDDVGLKVTGPEFVVPLLDGEDYLSVACSTDKTFARLKNIQGEYTVDVIDSEGNPRIVELAAGATIKIWQKASETEDALIVTILITDANNTLQEAINYRKDMEGAIQVAAAAREAEAPAEEEPEIEEDGEEPGTAPPAPPTTTSLQGEPPPPPPAQPQALPSGGRPSPDIPTPTPFLRSRP